MGIFQVCIGYIRHMLGMSFKNIVGKYLGHILLGWSGWVKSLGLPCSVCCLIGNGIYKTFEPIFT